MTDRLGQQFGQYRLGRFLGQGSFGEVYLGEHIHHNNTLAAVKVLQARLTAEDLKEFINEASTTFRLQHPHIVRLLMWAEQPSPATHLPTDGRAASQAPLPVAQQKKPLPSTPITPGSFPCACVSQEDEPLSWRCSCW
jgi:protein tyrosine kinase